MSRKLDNPGPGDLWTCPKCKITALASSWERLTPWCSDCEDYHRDVVECPSCGQMFDDAYSQQDRIIVSSPGSTTKETTIAPEQPWARNRRTK